MIDNTDSVKKDLLELEGTALVVLYGKQNTDGTITLDFFTTDEYENADSVLKADVMTALKMIK